MGHEGVDNALAYNTGLCTCMQRERIIQQMGPQIGCFILDRRSAGVGWLEK